MTGFVERVILAVIVAVAVVVTYALLSRRRRTSTVADNAVIQVLRKVSQAMPGLRAGLSEEAADIATPHLRELLDCVAVAITDDEGAILSWDGEATRHSEDLEPWIARAIAEKHRELVEHEKVRCDHRGNCPMRSAVIVPLIVDGYVEGTLVVVGGVRARLLYPMTEEIARYLRTELELAKLDDSRQELAKAEVKFLRAQISPHFVYNALNTISQLIRTDPERARELLIEFAEFTRYSFRSSGMFTTLADELRNIDRYLEIERARYGTRLNVRLKIAPEVMQVVVPFLVLQPLVENAIKHGVAKKPGEGTVTVVAQDNGPEALISVEDDGVGMEAERLESDLANAHASGAHVGLGNVNQRMRSVFGAAYALIVDTAPGAGTKVTVRVPKFVPGVHPDLPPRRDRQPLPDGPVPEDSGVDFEKHRLTVEKLELAGIDHERAKEAIAELARGFDGSDGVDDLDY